MVTVIASKELTAPNNNGVTGSNSSDNERLYQSLKDYQEVDFDQAASCRPLPDGLIDSTTRQLTKTSIKGTFYVQINTIEPFIQKEQSILLTLTDGIVVVKAITNDYIPNLNLNSKTGNKLLLSNIIQIKDGLLQLTRENTRFHYGSNRYLQPRMSNRNRTTGSYRSSNEGKYNKRYDNDDNDTRFLKRPPPKTTLMDFMTKLNISIDKDSSKRRSDPNSNSSLNTNTNNNNSNDELRIQQDGYDEQADVDDDGSHTAYRERRNQLPPRFQRAQEERSRHGTNRYYDETMTGNEINNVYRNDVSNNQSLSSMPSSYSRNNGQHHSNANYYGQHPNLLTSVNGAASTHMAYYPTNANHLTYPLAGIPSPPYPNTQTLMAPSYPNDHMSYGYGTAYGATNYASIASENISNGDLKINGNVSSDNENSGIQHDENNDSGIKCELSSNEQKQTPTSLNDSQVNVQEEKHRDSHANTRHRWRVGDMCLARWSEDGQYYYANIVNIQSPIVTVCFCDYNNCEEVRFGDLKMIPRDQPYYSYIPPSVDLNLAGVGPYFVPRQNYYSTTMDPCVVMPEVPPFPFDSSGTVYMYGMTPQPMPRPNRSHSNAAQQLMRRNENGDSTLNSSSPPSKDSNDTSAIDSTTASMNEENQMCSIADASINVIPTDDTRERTATKEGLTNSKYDEKQMTKQSEEETKE